MRVLTFLCWLPAVFVRLSIVDNVRLIEFFTTAGLRPMMGVELMVHLSQTAPQRIAVTVSDQNQQGESLAGLYNRLLD